MFDYSIPSLFGVLLATVIGLCMGSFSSVVLARTEPEDSIGGRSRCPHCRKTLSAFELIPLLSYVIQRGKCRGCAARISLRYPLLELLGVAAFLAGWALTDAMMEGLALGLVLWAMGSIVISDLSTHAIPDLLTALLAIGALIVHLPDTFVPAVIAGAVGGAFLGIQWVVSHGKWMGSGDVLLITALGFFVGRWEGMIVALAVAYVIGAIFATGILISKGAAARRMHLPFGPFLIGGALLAYVAGERILTILM